MVTLPEPESGTKGSNWPHPNMTLSPQCYLPNHKRFGLFEVLKWFRDGAFRDGHWEV